MGQQTSINVQPAKGGSEQHNKREKELDYVRPELSHLNHYWESDTQANRLATIKELTKAKTGRTMQAKATPIREGVVVIQESTTMEDLHRLADAYRDRLGVEVFQIAIHRDEGHKGSKEWKPNLHAHLVFDWTDHSKGKSVKLNRQKMAEMQTITAEVLGMERGKSSEKKHLTAQQYKAAAEAERAEKEAKRAEQLEEQVAELSTIKATKEEAISTIKKTGKHAIDWVTGKTRRKEKAAKEQIEYLTGQVITAREIGQQEGRQSALQEIIQAARVRFEDLTPENIGRSLAHWISKANRLEKEVRTLKEAAETAKQEKLQIGREQYQKGLNIAQTQIKGLQEDVYELIRNYANGDPNVILHYSIPREDRLRKEQERQEAERKKREQEGKKKGLRLVEAPKQERTEEEQQSRGFKR